MKAGRLDDHRPALGKYCIGSQPLNAQRWSTRSKGIGLYFQLPLKVGSASDPMAKKGIGKSLINDL